MNYILIEYNTVSRDDSLLSKVSEVISFKFINDISKIPHWFSKFTMDDQHYQHMSIRTNSYYTLLDCDKLEYFENKGGWIYEELYPIARFQIRNKRIESIIR